MVVDFDVFDLLQDMSAGFSHSSVKAGEGSGSRGPAAASPVKREGERAPSDQRRRRHRKRTGGSDHGDVHQGRDHERERTSEKPAQPSSGGGAGTKPKSAGRPPPRSHGDARERMSSSSGKGRREDAAEGGPAVGHGRGPRPSQPTESTKRKSRDGVDSAPPHVSGQGRDGRGGSARSRSPAAPRSKRSQQQTSTDGGSLSAHGTPRGKSQVPPGDMSPAEVHSSRDSAEGRTKDSPASTMDASASTSGGGSGGGRKKKNRHGVSSSGAGDGVSLKITLGNHDSDRRVTVLQREKRHS